MVQYKLVLKYTLIFCFMVLEYTGIKVTIHYTMKSTGYPKKCTIISHLEHGIFLGYQNNWYASWKLELYFRPTRHGFFLGYHTVRIVGWGRECSLNYWREANSWEACENYWIVANSWGVGWGENGFAKIRMHTCGIEDMVVAMKPFSDRTCLRKVWYH